MIRIAFVVAALSAIGCANDPAAPSCQQGLAHYYAAGCTYLDATTNPPTPIAEGEMLSLCQDAAINAPDRCQDDLDAWLRCNAAVPDRVTSNADCDCSASYMALLRCE